MVASLLHSHTPPAIGRLDTVTAIALIPFISFMSRRPYVSVGDAIELAIIILLEVRMLLSATGYLPLTKFEASANGVVTLVGVLVVLNIAVFLMPSLRKHF